MKISQNNFYNIKTNAKKVLTNKQLITALGMVFKTPVAVATESIYST